MSTHNRPGAGIAFIMAGMVAISLNDMLIKQLSDQYALHQIVLTRSVIGLICVLMLVQAEGGWAILKTRHPLQHALRGILIVISNMAFFIALSAIPLADATALFFVAPLFITLLSIPFLGEKVGPMRIGAVAVGFLGVIIMQRPWAQDATLQTSRILLLLPVFAAMTYAMMQLLTRKLGATSKASALAVYIQSMFIVVSLAFWLVAGDGRFATGSDDPGIRFLFRAWRWPDPADWWLLIGLGLCSAVIAYCMSQAYRLSDAATVAPFEYALMPMAVLWGWLLWSDLPDPEVWIGMALIVGSGLFVFLREKQKARKLARTGIKARY